MRNIYWLIQSLVTPIIGAILKFKYNIKVFGAENWKGVRSPVIIASNHKTLFDGFLITLTLSLGSRILPLRFMIESFRFRGTKLELLRKLGMIAFFRFISGGFPSNRHRGIDNAIKIPVKILKKGGTVLMFPEGWLIKEDSLGKFFNGTSALAIASGAPIMPVHIKVKNKDIFITVGELFSLETNDVEEGTAILREKILELSESGEALH